MTLSPGDHIQDLCFRSCTGTLMNQLAGQFRVYSIPTLAVVKDGQLVNQMVGARPKHQILGMF